MCFVSIVSDGLNDVLQALMTYASKENENIETHPRLTSLLVQIQKHIENNQMCKVGRLMGIVYGNDAC